MPRKVRVSTIGFKKAATPATIAANIGKGRQLLELACATGPDIVCLPETFAYLGVEGKSADKAEPIPGPITDMARAVARAHSTYVICPLLESRGDVVYNVAVLIDRAGQIVGSYEKVHPVTSTSDYTELERGVTPGAEPKVFDTDFGRIGILICFDLTYPQEWDRLGEMGAEIVFWPSAYDGGFPLRVNAARNGYYVVTAVKCIKAAIIDVTGEILVEADRFQSVVEAEIDLEKGLYHADFNAAQIPALIKRYGRDVRIRTFGDDALMTVESMRDDLTVSQIEAEIGLEPLRAYRRRNLVAREALRQGRAPEPQVTPYLGRVMHV